MSKPQGLKTVVTSLNRTYVTPSSSTKETNTQEQDVNNLPTGTLKRQMQGEKGELLLGNGYGYGYALDFNNWPILNLLPSEIAKQIHMVMSLDEEGEVYAWGENKNYKLGTVSLEILLTPTKIAKLKEEHIIEMAVSSSHNIVLTKDGKVYTWGNFEYENLFNRSEEGLPWQVEFDSDSDEIIHVSCGLKFNMALTQNGNVYSWGLNEFGVLGLNNSDEETIITHPSIISSLIGPVIVKVVCGESHTLALTATGELYVWGVNQHRELGYDTEKDFSTIPTKLNVPEVGKIVDIFARTDLSVAINEKQHVYKWGNLYNNVVPVPTFIRLSNMYNILKDGIPYIIHKPQIDHNEDKSELQELIFNDPSTSDITIEVDGKVFYAHKIILIRSEHFVNLLTYKMIKENRIIVHDKYSYNVYESFLKYTYTGMVNASLEEALELMKFADAYNETNLKNICVKVIQKGINLCNVNVILKEAISYNSKELKEYCFEFLFMELVNKVRMSET